jgi:hypothetical protein
MERNRTSLYIEERGVYGSYLNAEKLLQMKSSKYDLIYLMILRMIRFCAVMSRSEGGYYYQCCDFLRTVKNCV